MKKILLSGLVALGLFAMGCSNDDVIDNGSNPAVSMIHTYSCL